MSRSEYKLVCARTERPKTGLFVHLTVRNKAVCLNVALYGLIMPCIEVGMDNLKFAQENWFAPQLSENKPAFCKRRKGNAERFVKGDFRLITYLFYRWETIKAFCSRLFAGCVMAV